MSDDWASQNLRAIEVKSLNYHERKAIEDALREYVDKHGQNAWAQKAVLDEMLPDLMWMDKKVSA
jgi:hypothetical protein